jgi:hypothetical protein
MTDTAAGTFEPSNGIARLATALAKAQGKIKAALKDSFNPHFKNDYAGLASIWDACRQALSEHGLSIVQIPETREGILVLRTLMLHESGESLESILPLPVPQGATAQQIGAAITYMRKYALASMAGVAAEDDDDDDGNSISKPITFWDRQSYTLPPPDKANEKAWADTFMSGIAKAPSRAALAKYQTDNQKFLDSLTPVLTNAIAEACAEKAASYDGES